MGEWPGMSCSLAIKALDKLKREQEEADWAEPRVHLTMAQAYAYYLRKKSQEGKSTSFLQQIDQAWRCVPNELRRTLLDQVPLYRLADLVAEVAIERKGTAFHVRRLLKAIYKFALTNEWCSKDRALAIEPVALQPKRLLVSNEQIARVLEVANLPKGSSLSLTTNAI